MGDYFKPWRRKIGVLTLGLACVLMAARVRSVARPIIIPAGNYIEYVVRTDSSRIRITKEKQIWSGGRIIPNEVLGESSIPHDAVAIPLTLFSAWLLLSKPRAKSVAKIS
jgi:hypothetical protein